VDAADVSSPVELAGLAERIGALAAGASIEMSARDLQELDRAAAWLKPGGAVSITWLPNDTMDQRVAGAAAVRAAGFEPVPHVAARFVESREDLELLLRRLVDEAGVRRLFLIAGDVKKPRGPFTSSLEVLRTGLIEAVGVGEVGVAAYPEGHPKIDDALLEASFRDKVALAGQTGVDLFAITQLCFEAAPIAATLRRLRAGGFARPIRIGLSGPASLSTLIKFAARCGVGASAKAIVSRGASIARLLVDAGPDPIIRDLAERAGPGELGNVSLHFFPFGGFERTAKWMRAVADGRFAIPTTQSGFHVEA
jgi:methylenetetrahydrofolate reductase (NADPH)